MERILVLWWADQTITFRRTYYNRTFISLRGVSLLVCLGNQRFSASCHEQGKLCVTGVDIDQNVSSKHLHRNDESTSTGKVSCCQELNQNSFYVSIQVDTSCVHSLLTAGWPKLPCKCKSQTKTAPSPFALRISS